MKRRVVLYNVHFNLLFNFLCSTGSFVDVDRCVKFLPPKWFFCHFSCLIVYDSYMFMTDYISISDLQYCVFSYYYLFLPFLSILRELFKFIIFVLTYFLQFYADFNFVNTVFLFWWYFIHLFYASFLMFCLGICLVDMLYFILPSKVMLSKIYFYFCRWKWFSKPGFFWDRESMSTYILIGGLFSPLSTF